MVASAPLKCLILNGATIAAGGSGDVAAFHGADCVFHRTLEGLGAVGSLAALCRDMFETLHWHAGPDLIIAVIGPGSFTGLRASLALANGFSLGYGAQLRGVTTGQAFRTDESLIASVCVTQARRNRLYVEFADGGVWAGPPEALVLPVGTIVLGNGVSMLDDTLAEHIVKLDCTRPDIVSIYKAGLAAPSQSALHPLYVDAPEAKLPAQGLRPAPRR